MTLWKEGAAERLSGCPCARPAPVWDRPKLQPKAHLHAKGPCRPIPCASRSVGEGGCSFTSKQMHGVEETKFCSEHRKRHDISGGAGGGPAGQVRLGQVGGGGGGEAVWSGWSEGMDPPTFLALD